MKALLLALALVASTAHAAEWTPADTHRAWGIYGILMGSIAFFYLSVIWERDDDD